MINLDAAEAAVRRTAAVGSTLALAGAASYGINIVFARICAQMGVSGADIIAYRSIILLPFLALLVLAAGLSLKVPPPQRPVLLRFALSAAATAIFYLTSLQYLPVPVAVTVFYTYPLIVMLLTPFVDRLRLPARRWLIAGLAFIGVILAVGPVHATLDGRGLVFAGLGSLCAAAMFLNGARLETDSRVTFFWCQAIAAPAALAFAWSGAGLAKPELLLVAATPFAVTSICYFLGFTLQILAAARITAATASLLFLLEPLFAIAGAAFLLAETLGVWQAVGVLLVVLALAADLWPTLKSAPPLAAAP